MDLVLTRTYFPEGTNGQLTCNGKLICKTIELPWKENERGVSCVPEGKYFIKKRYSAKHGFHLELLDVPSRSLILIHPANHALTELNGCIAPVTKLSGAGLGLQSRKAFATLKTKVYQALAQGDPVVLFINS
jgi:hypothetical protein